MFKILFASVIGYTLGVVLVKSGFTIKNWQFWAILFLANSLQFVYLIKS